MCGFTAFFSLSKSFEGIQTRIIQAARLIEHRGPDDEAFYFSPEYCAGFRRLSIIDLTDAGRQPMADPSKRFWIVFNGEIYNYKEIRQELVALGHRFKTNSDTEVLLTAFVQWGSHCVPKLNGMFAFLIWDSLNKTLFGARDRFGEKPLFYAHTKNGIAWSSEIKGLAPLLDHPIQPNDQILSDYLVEGKIDHSNNTFFDGVFSFPASHQFTLQNGHLQITPYWTLNATEKAFHGNAEDAVEQFRNLFEDSIRLRMRSDVPIGTCLSGGLDSSSIVCMIAKMLGTEKFQSATRKTFTAHYPEFDESQQLDDVVRQTQCESFRISPKPLNLDSLRELLWFQDEPFMSFSVFASREVMRKANHEQVKVLINGQGADEVLAGYSKFLMAYLSDLLHLGQLGGLLAATQNEKHFTGRSSLQSISTLAKEESKRLIGKFAELVGAKQRLARRERYDDQVLVTSDFISGKSHPQFRRHANDAAKTGRLKSWLIRSMFIDNLPLYLRVEDRNAMSFSLESRLPFLDHRIAEFVLGLPTQWLMKEGKNKWLLRKSMQGLVPSSVVDRKNKFGFPAPDAVWQTGYLRNDILDLLNSQRFKTRGIFDTQRVHRLFQSLPVDISGNPKGLQPKIRQLFRIISAELWIQELARYEKIRLESNAMNTNNTLDVNVVS